MRYARLLRWPPVLSLFIACVTFAVEKPCGLRRDPGPSVTNSPAAIMPPHATRKRDAAPSATRPATGPATAPADALPPTGPTGADAIAALTNPCAVRADAKRDWLLLVYICGDNDLEIDAWVNLKQMEIGIPDSGVEVIVLLDCHIKRADDGTVNHPALYRIRKSKGTEKIDSEVLKDFGAINMADPYVLSAFIEGAVRAFPARQHALCAWGHGGGWKGLLYEDLAPGKEGRDHMDMPTFRAGVVGGMHAAGLAKWDILTFDMCLMGQLEVAAEIHDLAGIMVASEESEPGTGFPYARVLELLGKGTLGGRRIGSDIVQEYERFHAADGNLSTTLSAFDLSRFDDVNSKLNALADKLIPAMPRSWSKLSKSLYYAEQYGIFGYNGRSFVHSVDLLDALKKCRAAMPDFPAETEYLALVEAMDRFIIASATDRRRRMSNGLAIHAPLTRDHYDPEYEKTGFFKISHWPTLLKAIYAEQAKNTEPPKFGKIELVDFQDKPISAMKPLSRCGIFMEVEGKDLVCVSIDSCMRDPELGGTRCFSKGYVIDRDAIKKINQGVEKFARDADVVMPQLIDGRNALRHPRPGVMIGLSNGQTKVQAMIDHSDLTDTAKFSIPVLIEHPSYGNKPRKATLRGDFKSFAVTSVLLFPEADGSIEPGKTIEPPADARIIPQFQFTRDGETSDKMVAKGSLTWNSGLALTIALQPAGEYEDGFFAWTMTGVVAYADLKYRVADNEFALHAPQTWQTFKSEMMIGNWQVRSSPIPPLEFDTNVAVDVRATEKPFNYRVSATSVDAEGKKKVTEGNLIFEIQGQPIYRLIYDAVGKNESEILIGAMAWVPRGDSGCVFTYALGFEQNFVWLQKGVGAGPGPISRDSAPPHGWHKIGDPKEGISLMVPPGFVTNEQSIKDGKKIFDGYDIAGIDANLKAAVEIIRFDGINDADQVAKALVAGYKQKGIVLALGDADDTRVGGIATVFYCAAASKGADDKAPVAVGLYLIPTPRGIVVVSFNCPSEQFEILAPTMWRILGTTRVVTK